MAGLVVALVLAGCATISTLGRGPGAALLARADEQMAAANYPGARDLYAEFLAAHGADAAAPRARATQVALDRLLVAHAEVDRFRADVARLRADLERLRSIDLRPERRR